MIGNLASSRWSKEEVSILSKYIDSTDYVMLEDLLPGRSKASIKAKQKRLLKEDPIPNKLKGRLLYYHLEGESDGQILKRLTDAGYFFTLRDIGSTLLVLRKELAKEYSKEHNDAPTLDKLKLFLESKTSG
jgi:hypothetical protein